MWNIASKNDNLHLTKQFSKYYSDLEYPIIFQAMSEV